MPALRYTVRARRDLLDIWHEVSEVNPSAADDLYHRLEARVEKYCANFPKQAAPDRI